MCAVNQQSLFDEETPKSEIEPPVEEVNVRDDGAAYKQVPLIVTKVYEDKPIGEKENSSKTLNKKVAKLYEQGLQVEEIAAELNCSISEVQFIIDLSIKQ